MTTTPKTRRKKTLDELAGRIRTPAILRAGRVSGSAATICQCGGLLAEDDRGRVFCLDCGE